MNVLFSLIKTNLNNNFGFSVLKHTKDKKKRIETFITIAALFVGISAILFTYSFLLSNIYMVGNELNHPQLVLTIAFNTAQILVFIFGIFYIISAFYFSNDLYILIPLPLKPSHIVISKLTVIMVNEYLTLLPIIIPALIIYGASMSKIGMYWVKAVILMLMAPIPSLILASILVIIIMRFINIRRSKDLFMVMGSIIAILVGIGTNLFVQKIPAGSEHEFFKAIIMTQYYRINQLQIKFSPSLLATNSLVISGTEGLLYFILFILESVLLCIVLLWIANKIFYKSLLSGEESSYPANHSKSGKTLLKMKVRGPILSLFIREWKLFIRTTVYALNGLTGMIIVPFFMAFSLYSQNSEKYKLIEFIRNPDITLYTVITGLSFMLFVAGMSIVACTSLSREGKTFWISKMIPVLPKDQVIAKLLHSMSISCIGIILTGIMISIILRLSPFRITMLFFLGILGSLLINSLNLLIDVIHPKLEWDDAQQAIKSNINSLFGFLVCIAIITLLSLFSTILIGFDVAEPVLYLVLSIIIIILIIPSIWGLLKIAQYKYNDIEI